MAETIRVRGRDFSVERFEHDVSGKTVVAYRLCGTRGAAYVTLRNVPRPELMFLVHDDGRFGMPGTMKGVWLTDKGGKLTVFRG